MPANQNRNNKKSFAEDKRNNRATNRAPGKPNETDQFLHRPYRGYDEEKINRTDYSQQIGEFSDWRKRE